MDVEKRFLFGSYSLKTFSLAIIFGGLSAWAAFTSLTRERPSGLGLLFNKLGLNESMVLKFCGFFGLVLTLYLIALIIFSLYSGKRYILLTKISLFVPSIHFSYNVKEISLINILTVQITDSMNQKYIRIQHKSGKIDLAQTMFKNKEAFAECYSSLVKSMQGA